MTAVDNLPEICTPKEAGKYLRLDTREINKLCRNGELEHMRPFPRKVLIPREKIMEYKERCLEKTKESISDTEKTEAGKSGNISEESVSGMQVALAAVDLQKENLQKSSQKNKDQKHPSNILPLVRS